MWVDADLIIHMQTKYEISLEIEGCYGETIEIEELMREPAEIIKKQCRICGDVFYTDSKKRLICDNDDCKQYAYLKRQDRSEQRQRVKEAVALYRKGWTFQEIYLEGYGNSRGNVERFIRNFIEQQPLIQASLARVEAKRRKNGV